MIVGELYNPKKLFTGIFVPESMARLPTSCLSPGAKLLFGRLSWHVNEEGECFPSREKLAEEIGASESSVRDYLRELENEAFIIRVRSGPKSNNYDFPWHPVLESSLRKKRQTPECPSKQAPPEGVTDTRMTLDGHPSVSASLVTEDLTEERREYIDFQMFLRMWCRHRGFKKPNKSARERAESRWTSVRISEPELTVALDGYFDSDWGKNESFPILGFLKDPHSWISQSLLVDLPPIKFLPAIVIQDKLFDDYMSVFIAAGVAIGDKEREDAMPTWANLTEDQKMASGRDAVRICQGSEPKYIKSPAKHLADRPWTRVVQPRIMPKAGQMTKAEQTRLLALERGWM